MTIVFRLQKSLRRFTIKNALTLCERRPQRRESRRESISTISRACPTLTMRKITFLAAFSTGSTHSERYALGRGRQSGPCDRASIAL